jgi:hypothetical protein
VPKVSVIRESNGGSFPAVVRAGAEQVAAMGAGHPHHTQKVRVLSPTLIVD